MPEGEADRKETGKERRRGAKEKNGAGRKWRLCERAREERREQSKRATGSKAAPICSYRRPIAWIQYCTASLASVGQHFAAELRRGLVLGDSCRANRAAVGDWRMPKFGGRAGGRWLIGRGAGGDDRPGSVTAGIWSDGVERAHVLV